jgi:hypothetical protein
MKCNEQPTRGRSAAGNGKFRQAMNKRLRQLHKLNLRLGFAFVLLLIGPLQGGAMESGRRCAFQVRYYAVGMGKVDYFRSSAHAQRGERQPAVVPVPPMIPDAGRESKRDRGSPYSGFRSAPTLTLRSVPPSRRKHSSESGATGSMPLTPG